MFQGDSWRALRKSSGKTRFRRSAGSLSSIFDARGRPRALRRVRLTYSPEENGHQDASGKETVLRRGAWDHVQLENVIMEADKLLVHVR